VCTRADVEDVSSVGRHLTLIASPPPSATGVRVLLVEDNAVNQIVAEALLERRGFEVVVAGNGREGVEAFQRERFDLVLMDIQMPEMDGPPDADRGPDRARAERGSGAVPGRRHGRVPVEAHRLRAAFRDHPQRPRRSPHPGVEADLQVRLPF